MRATMIETIQYRVCESPIGGLLLAADTEALRTILFLGPMRTALSIDGIRERLSKVTELTPGTVLEEGGTVVDLAAKQLDEYFAGTRKVFDLPLSPAGTEFQQRVWKTLLRIGHGETWSYGDLANAIGKPTASRAVGAANGRNPLPIVIPCHRVIGADGSLTGYGGGVDIKRTLLELEGCSSLG